MHDKTLRRKGMGYSTAAAFRYRIVLKISGHSLTGTGTHSLPMYLSCLGCFYGTVKTQTIELYRMLCRWSYLRWGLVFFLFFCFLCPSGGLSGSFFAAFSPPFLKWVILDYMAHGSIIWVPAGTVITLRAILGELAKASEVSHSSLCFHSVGGGRREGLIYVYRYSGMDVGDRTDRD